MERLGGKVAFISGIARGQGRSHAVRMAQEGAKIIGFDICEQIDTVPFAMSTPEDMAETVRLVESVGGKIVARRADVRDREAVTAVLEEGVEQFGRIDDVICNAGAMFGYGLLENDLATLMKSWQDAIDVLLTGSLNTIVAALPRLMSQGDGGSIVITSSTAGLTAMSGPANAPEDVLAPIGYTAAKTGVIGLMRAFAGSLAHLNIRVNTVHPTGVNTPFVTNPRWNQLMEEQIGVSSRLQNAMPVTLIEPEDVSNAVIWLCSDEARYVTGVQLPVDAGFLVAR